MPLKPVSDFDSQSAWMQHCVPTEIGTGPDKRPQEQAVAICLDMWRKEHGGKPPEKADVAGWMARLKDLLAEVTARAKTSIKVDQVWIPGEVGEDGLPVNYAELLALLAQQEESGVPKEPGKPAETKPTAISSEQPREPAGSSEGGQWSDGKSLKTKRAEPGSAEAKRPYGEVSYADPGYQEDKIKRYPIDTERHIRAAWNYIHKEKNQTPYTRDEVKKIKQRVVKAWKDKIDDEGPPGLEDDPHLGKTAQETKVKAVNAEDVDVPSPDEGEGQEEFHTRCVGEVTDQDVDESHAESLCALAWENRSATHRVRHKVHAEQVSADGLYCLSDESADRMGDIIDSSGWSLDAFKKNPIALFNHRADFVVGKWRDLHVADKQLRGHLILAPAGTSDRIDEIRKLIAADILRAVSVGFRPIQSQPRKVGDKFVGEYFQKQELVETSLVSVPANPNALAIAKSLSISDETLDVVFAKHGIRSDVRKSMPDAKAFGTVSVESVVAPGKIAATAQKMGGGKMSLDQRITDSQTRINALRDKLTDHLAGVDDSNVSDAQLAITEELHQRIAQEQKQHFALLESQKFLAGNLIPTNKDGNGSGDGMHRAMIVHGANGGGRSGNIPATKEGRLDIIIRAGIVAAFAHIHKVSLEQSRLALAQEYPRYGDDCTKVFSEYAAKQGTDVRPATTFQTGWAAELVQTLYADMMDLLLPKSVFPTLSGMGLALSFGRAGRISIPRRETLPSIAGSFVGEGQPIPVRRAGFAAEILVPKKMAVITTWTRELSESSVPAIEGLLRNAIQEDTAQAIDVALLSNNAATAIRPAGLLNGITPITASTATPGFNAIVEDMKNVIGALLTATRGNVRKLALIVNPAQTLALGLAAMPGMAAFPFKDEVSAGRLLSYPIIESGMCDPGTVIAVDAADFVTVGGEAPRFELSDQATLHYDDEDPQDITGGTPSPAVPVRSLWQTDSIGLRLILPLNWTMRRPDVVTYVDGVNW